MMKTRTNLIVALFALCFTGTVSDAYAWGWHKRKSVKNDSVVTSESKYDELVKKAKTREGMFRIHQVEKDWYFEIDDSLMNRDLLIVNKVSGVPYQLNDAGLNKGMAYEDKLIPMFEEANLGVTVKGTYDSSGKLQTQIEEGLEADVFMSAAKKHMTALDEEGMIASDTITDLLENKIVLIVPTGNEKKLEKFEDIENADSIALGDPASVPAGQYAQEALTNLGIWDKIQDKVSFGTNVTEVLNQVAAASADAGIVYATDAASMADQVEVVAEAPEGSLAKKVIYPVAVVKGTAHEEVAKEFVAFLQTDKAITVFEEYGFSSAQ